VLLWKIPALLIPELVEGISNSCDDTLIQLYAVIFGTQSIESVGERTTCCSCVHVANCSEALTSHELIARAARLGLEFDGHIIPCPLFYVCGHGIIWG